MVARIQDYGLANLTAAWLAAGAVPPVAAAKGPSYLGWGTGNAAAKTATNLTTPTGTRTATSNSQVTTTVTNDTFQSTATLTAGGTLAIQEVGVFDSSTGNNLIIYGDFSTINLASNDSIAFTIKVQFS